MNDRALQNSSESTGIAIISMAGRFPGANTIEQFWHNLRTGVDSVSRFSPEELDVRPETRRTAGYVPSRSILPDVDMFDAAFFGVYPREAEQMDPQHRIFLECCWESLERGGYDPARYTGMIGVFAGCSMNTYFMRNLVADRAFLERFTEEYQSGSYTAMLGNDKDFLPTRVSYKLNLRGPSMAVQSACSTSLVAICQACQSLLTYGCDMALAGGVSITFPQRRGYQPEEGGIVSTDGVVRPFDHRAKGTVFGSGSGVVLLKRLDDALADRDQVLAVIRGFAINNDGALKAGYTAPSAEGQAEVISAAHAMAGFAPASISYVEAHGTGTPMGDPIEIAGLARAFVEVEPGSGSCSVGTAKANVGHLDVAAGVTGLIKTVLQMQYREIPGLLHFERANPEIELSRTPFHFAKENSPWQSKGTPLRAGVSAFGVGGTNAHVVLEESQAPLPNDFSMPSGPQLLVLSAKTETALNNMRERLADHLEAHPGLCLRNVAYTLAEGRASHALRFAAVASTGAEAVGHFRRDQSARLRPALSRPKVAFVFPGQGAQRLNMARALWRDEPVFRDTLLQCEEIARPLLGESLVNAIYPDQESSERFARIHQTFLAQPAILAVEYAIAQWWRSLGIEPALLVGHSIGEYAAATVAKALTIEQALNLVIARGRLMQLLAPGSMLAVRASEDQLRPILTDSSLCIAAVNGPTSIVVAGSDAAIVSFSTKLEEAGIGSRKLATSHAFHSSMMDPVLEPFGEQLRRVSFQDPEVPWISTVTGHPLTKVDIAQPQYWQRQLREPVVFAKALQQAAEHLGDQAVFLEIGPAATVLGAMRQSLGKHIGMDRILSTLPAYPDADVGVSADDAGSILTAVGELWKLGIAPQWKNLFEAPASSIPQRVLLPTYPFDRKRYWSQTASPTSEAPQELGATHYVPTSTSDSFPMTKETSSLPDAVFESMVTDLKALVSELSDLELSSTQATTSFVELGLDSLFLTQFTQALRKKYGIKITFRQIMGEFGTFAALARHISAASTPASAQPVPALPADLEIGKYAQPAELSISSETPTIPASYIAFTPAPASEHVSLFSQQLQAVADVIKQQLRILERGATVGLSQEAASPKSDTPVKASEAGGSAPGPLVNPRNASTPGIAEAPDAKLEEKEFGTLVPLRSPDLRPNDFFSSKQEQHIAALTETYNRRTAQSKAHVQRFRSVLADPRVPSGFHPSFKELTYPIVIERSAGAYLWDTDGNRYIDILNGYGSIFFGHSPQFVTDAVRRQLDRGFPIGPQTELAGECAQLLSELTGMERVSFCNTGSEAVMAAMRLARTVTGRSLVVLFSGSYHGMVDEVLVKSTRSERSMPAAPGIPSESVANVLVLEYGSAAALDVIRRRKDEIAAVLVEPIQSRHPALRPIEFLRELRRITEEAGSALIFDEVVTGFRTHPGGAQAIFGIRADLVTYGKVVGGGMPVGVIAGSRVYMDALDGGNWRFGDNSSPEVGVTFFAGTFVRHPLTMAAVKSVLKHIQATGPALQENAARKTSLLAQDLCAMFTEFAFPSTLEHFSSWFFFPAPTEMRLARLLYHHLRERGVHLQEGFPCFLSTAHTDEDLQFVRSTFRAALTAMRDGHALPNSEVPSGLFQPDSAVFTAGQVDSPSSLSNQGTKACNTHFSPDTNPTSGAAPITEAQREILLASQFDDTASCAFNESVTLTLQGSLDRAAFTSAVASMVRRHEALRLSVVPECESILVDSTTTLDISEEDWSFLDDHAQLVRKTELLEREASTPFDLKRAPLLRATLVSLRSDRHLFILTGHHIVLDGWSMNVFFEELSTLYSARLSGNEPVLQPAHSFLKHAVSEKEYIATEEHSATEAFWVKHLDQAPCLIELPTDHPRPIIRSHQGSTYRHGFSPAFTKLVRNLAQEGANTVFTTLLSAFAALLSRLTQQEEFAISVPVAGQRELIDGSLMGHAVCFLPIRVYPRVMLPFDQFAREVKDTIFDALDHSSYTVGSLVQKLPIACDPARGKFAEVQFNFEQVGANLHFSHLDAHLEANPKAAVNADLFFNFVDCGDSLILDCDYSTALFDESTVARWIASFETLVRHAATVPSSTIGDLDLLSEEEQKRILIDWNATALDYPHESTVSQIFEAQAKASPEAVALCFEDEVVTYAELNEQANKIALWIREQLESKASPRIAISLERSPELISVILGILKAGGIYIPLDSSYPAARLVLLLEDAKPDLLITQQTLLERFVELPVRIVCWEDMRLPASKGDDILLSPHDGGNEPAYLMYTSGSTGKPKGVLVPHRAILRLVKHTDYADFGPDQTFLQLAPVSFDAATFEIWGALLNGGRLVLMPGTKPAPEEIGAVIKRYGVTTVWFTAALFHLLIMDHIEIFSPLKQVLAGGDVLSVALVRKLMAAAPHLRLTNGYGPTENTTFTCWHTIGTEDLQRASIPIGRPIANTRVYILDQQGRPVPVGVPGQLHAGGDGLALQYLNAPELTLAKFVTLDLGLAGQQRLYKTGDVARYRGDGVIEFLGRSDSQIKVRGFRVELGEIEHAAEQCPGIRAAVATARPDWVTTEDVPGDKRIALYAIAEPGLDPGQLKLSLRQHLRDHLPEHMQPQATLFLMQFPRTVNGKIDHRALPAPEPERALFARETEGARTPLESKLATIWSQVLQISDIGIHDSIFDLGGDSLSIFRITTKANQAGIGITAKHIFQYRTIAALSPEIEKGAISPNTSSTAQTVRAIPRDQFRKIQTL